MTVLGLDKILLRSFAPWEPLFLKDTKVVVDADDLVGFLHDKFSTGLYGGENLSFYMVVRSFFLNLQCSNVEPYFILRGCCDMKNQKLKHKQKKEFNVLSQLITAVKLNALDKIPKVLNLSARDVFLYALNEFPWKCIRVKSFPTTVCTAIAIILQCPVIGLSSDYYILMSKRQNIRNSLISQPYSSPTFLTLHLANLNLSGSSKSSGEKEMLFHKFIPKLSILARSSDFHLPLLAVLVGTDVVSNVRLPLELQEKLQTNNSTINYSQHRLSVLLEWFSQFDSNSIKPLEDVINCYPVEQRTSIINDMIHGISRFVCPLEETKSVMSLLSDKSYFNDTSTNTFTTIKSSFRSSGSVEDVINSLKGTIVAYLWHEDYTNGWPPRLLYNFRKGILFSKPSIYSSRGVFLLTAVEDPKCPFSVHETSFLIRRLHYQIYVSLERSLSMENKLVGLNPDVIEYMRQNDKLVMYQIPVKYIPLDFNKVSTDEVIKENLGFVKLPENNLIPKLLYSLAVVLSFWFQQLKYTSIEIPSVFSESSVGLAVASCAVANIYNDGSSISELCEFYNNLSRMPDQLSISGSNSTNFRIDIVHGFNAIQSTFNSFKDLVTTLNCLVLENKQSNYFTFGQSWILFPSGKLVHFLATQLASLEPCDRRYSVIRVWLPKLLFIKQRNPDATSRLTKAINTLITFIDLCDMIKISLPSSLDSFYSIHELESNYVRETMHTVPNLCDRNNTNLVNKPSNSTFNVIFPRGCRERRENRTSNKRIYNKPSAENIVHSAQVRCLFQSNFHSTYGKT
ncbi:unnamed protein product [Schistosoma haematobium]|uniref:Uncharacterized protein n=2 Tax=Schistosoma haematobium TaxID=6185 RepID=A0A094ZWF1_SCHHA|nr:unnamed protein product [Schistosoma haematobium]